jgi:ubiquinone/menaquinone biosynthesis C-methylase UbiE
MTDTKTYIKQLQESDPLREPVLRDIIRSLELPEGSRGLDAGCGIGLQTVLLAEAVGPAGRITSVDISPEFLHVARKMVVESNLSERITFQEGNIHNLPADDDTFDWLWSADCAGYPTEDDPLPLLQELARVVKPGGTVAVLAYSSQQFLPGHPMLEARLNATCSALIPYLRGKNPASIFTRALGWFHEAGLEEPSAHTFVGTVHAPLSGDIRQALVVFCDMLWGVRQPETSQEDWDEYQRLCRPDSPDFILHCPDYYGFFTYSLFQGRVGTSSKRLA